MMDYETCLLCEEPILATEPLSPTNFFDIKGNPRKAHVECALREVLGGIGHFEDHALWCLVRHDPDGGRSRRESAREVWAWVGRKGIS